MKNFQIFFLHVTWSRLPLISILCILDEQLVKNYHFIYSDKMTTKYLRLRSVRQIANSHILMQAKSIEEQKIEREIRKRIKKSIISHQDRFFNVRTVL